MKGAGGTSGGLGQFFVGLAMAVAGGYLLTNQVTVTYPVGSAPFMHKGNYIFDANNAFWYRVSNVSENPPANGQGSALITLDVPANASSPAAAPGGGPYAMFPRNIVDVYPLGGK